MNTGCYQFLMAEGVNLGAALEQPRYVQLKEKTLLLKRGIQIRGREASPTFLLQLYA